jgi:DeoR family transcriptional regulator, aga operon transcriptional repressor
MLRAERQAKILQMVREAGFTRSEELIKLLDTSHVTIRRDLMSLANQNLIKLEHGGATSIDYLQGIPEPQYDTKMFVQAEAKDAIAAEAVNLICDGNILFLDSGTTNFRIARKLSRQSFSKLTVITTDFMIAKELSVQSNITIILLGGIVRKSYYNTYGPYTEAILEHLKANIYFLGFDGASSSRGFSNTVLEEVPVKQKMIVLSDQVIAVGDSSKYSVDAPYLICGWDKIHRLITDQNIDQKYVDLFKDKGIQAIIAK